MARNEGREPPKVQSRMDVARAIVAKKREVVRQRREAIKNRRRQPPPISPEVPVIEWSMGDMDMLEAGANLYLDEMIDL